MELIVSTDRFRKYSDNIQEIVKEIRDNMDIDSMSEAKVISDSLGQIVIKVRTNNHEDYLKMRKSTNWPQSIFWSETGVNFHMVPNDLKLSISEVDKENIFDLKMLKKLMKQEQISNVERLCYNIGDTPIVTNKVNFTANNLKAYVDAQKIGFFFVDGIKHKATAQINHAKCFFNCGDLNHVKKYCKNRISVWNEANQAT